MTATVAERAELRAFTDDELLALFAASDDDDERASVLAEAERRDRAKAKARQAQQAIAGEWRDAMRAQFLAAEAYCAGNLLSAKGLAEGIEEPTVLWTGSEQWAMARASEELRNWWDANGGRLSFALFKRQLADAKRQEREERQAASGKPRRRPRPTWQGVPGGAVRPFTVRIGGMAVPAWLAIPTSDGTTTVHPTRAHAERHLAPPAPAPAPKLAPALPPGPPVAPGAIARYTAGLDVLARRALAARRQINGGIQR